MNKSLLASARHGVPAALLCIGFTFWLLKIDARPGSREGSDVDYLLWSGWVAFGLMLVVTAYAARKYIHKLRLSPETRHPVSVRALEKAESKLTEIRRGIMRGTLTTVAEVRDLAQRVLKEEGVRRVAKVIVRDGGPGEPRIVVTCEPTEPLGRVATWMHSHIYYGLASGFIVYLHGANSFASPLGAAMNLLTWIVIGTGIVGTFLFMAGPTWMTRIERDLCFEERFVLDRSIEKKIDELCSGEKLKADDVQPLVKPFRAVERSGSDVDARLTEALTAAVAAKPELQASFADLAVLIAQRTRVRSGLAKLMRIRWLINIWRAVHIPASIVLLAIVAVHIVSVWWY